MAAERQPDPSLSPPALPGTNPCLAAAGGHGGGLATCRDLTLVRPELSTASSTTDTGRGALTGNIRERGSGTNYVRGFSDCIFHGRSTGGLLQQSRETLAPCTEPRAEPCAGGCGTGTPPGWGCWWWLGLGEEPAAGLGSLLLPPSRGSRGLGAGPRVAVNMQRGRRRGDREILHA